jgi:predicted enzyme related to lactoylglutathione lyase
MTDPADPAPLAAPETQPPGIELFMTVIRVARWQTTVRWYIDALGLSPLLIDAAHEFALLSAGGGRVGLQGVKEAHLASSRGRVRLVFQVADLDRERRRLIDNGVAVAEPVENPGEGYREIRFQDPEGYSLRFFAWNDPARAGAFGDRSRRPVEDSTDC